jgi:hypothetical protein
MANQDNNENKPPELLGFLTQARRTTPRSNVYVRD